MDEYLLEINELRRRIAKLKFERASVVIIEELEAQLRILKAIYESASGLFSAGDKDRRLATLIWHHDYASPLLSPVAAK